MECFNTAKVMGFTYIDQTSNSNRPAGCYGYIDSATAYFNAITDASNTIPIYDSRGICRRGILFCVIYIISIFLIFA